MSFDCYPFILIAIPLVIPLLWWFQRNSVHPMGTQRRIGLLIVRTIGVALALIALAGCMRANAARQAVVIVLDDSQKPRPWWPREGACRGQCRSLTRFLVETGRLDCPCG